MNGSMLYVYNVEWWDPAAAKTLRFERTMRNPVSIGELVEMRLSQGHVVAVEITGVTHRLGRPTLLNAVIRYTLPVESPAT